MASNCCIFLKNVALDIGYFIICPKAPFSCQILVYYSSILFMSKYKSTAYRLNETVVHYLTLHNRMVCVSRPDLPNVTLITLIDVTCYAETRWKCNKYQASKVIPVVPHKQEKPSRNSSMGMLNMKFLLCKLQALD